MSMITRCPACETMFRVVPDQLRISAGWVRCGQCDEVFDASAHLVNDTPASDPPALAPVAAPQAIEASESIPPVPVSVPVATPEPEPEPESVLPQAVPAETVLLSEAPPPATLTSSDFQAIDFNLDDVSTKGAPSIEPATKSDTAVLKNHGLIDTVGVDEPVAGTQTPVLTGDFCETDRADLTAFDPPAEPISFLSNDTKPPVRSRRFGQWLLAVLGLLLFIGLVAQGLYQERQRLAAWEPRLSPWLEQVCDAVGCAVGPVMKIDAINVENSSFARVRADTYRLSFSLKNNALIPVSFPALELTLTDALDRPVVRRVLRASDLGASDLVIAASTEWSSSIEIAVQSATLPDRVAGYRVVAF